LAHDSKGVLTSILFAKQRRIADIANEWGENHPALSELKAARHEKRKDQGASVEEVWYFDTTNWAVALMDGTGATDENSWRYQNPADRRQSSGKRAFWLANREGHQFTRCPVVEDKRATFDGEYRGALDAMIPGLGTAQRMMSAVLEDIAQQIGAPVLLDNITNPEDYGPMAILEGDGQGRASMTALRAPSNFEARGLIRDNVEATRRVGKYPQQRTGEIGAAISSAKGTNAVMGNFNSELAAAQGGQLRLEKGLLSRTAELDAKWCDDKKRIIGFDEGTSFEETYLPSKMFNNDDYRVGLTLGGGLGMDQQNYMIQVATAKNMDGMSLRTFMEKTGLAEDVLHEESEMLLEQIADGFTAMTLQQAMEGANMQPLLELVDELDGDKTTARASVIAAIRKAFPVQADGLPGTPGPDADPDALLQSRSLESGGIPGQAEGLPQAPPIGESLSSLLPGVVGRAQESI
jgi:hypothetical protein